MSVYSWETTPIELQEDFGESRQLNVDGTTVAFEHYKAGSDTRPLFKDLPGGACSAQHWGYLVRGQFRVIKSTGEEEVVRGGNAYRLEPGHNIHIYEDVELVEVTPTEEREKTVAGPASAMRGG